MAYKKGVARELLDLCAGSDLEKHRLACVDEKRVDVVVKESDGMEVEAETWLKLNKQNLNR